MNRIHKCVTATSAVVASVALLAACGTETDTDSDTVTITVAGPNQWNSDPSSFGTEWEAQIERFEAAEPGITVETAVLPLGSFADTISTQLAAGTAPDLVFSQAPHEPYMVHSLSEELNQPNPYTETDDRWMDHFDPALFGDDRGFNVQGDHEFIPFNVFVPVVYVNADAFAEAGVEVPLETWGDLREAAPKLQDAGYDVFAADASTQGLMWTLEVIADQLMTPEVYDTVNEFAANGERGTTETLSQKDWAWAVRTGAIEASDVDSLKETLRFLKEFYDDFATPNWSGIQGSSASVVNQADLLNGTAAMAWGSSFAYPTVIEEADFEVASMPMPTITQEESDYADGRTARYGASIHGTAYMVPSTTEGEQFDAAVKFLQFMSAPDTASEWLGETGSLSALTDQEVPENLTAFEGSEWLQPTQIGTFGVYPVNDAESQALYGGYLLGSKNLDETVKDVQTAWEETTENSIRTSDWTDEWIDQ